MEEEKDTKDDDTEVSTVDDLLNVSFKLADNSLENDASEGVGTMKKSDKLKNGLEDTDNEQVSGLKDGWDHNETKENDAMISEKENTEEETADEETADDEMRMIRRTTRQLLSPEKREKTEELALKLRY